MIVTRFQLEKWLRQQIPGGMGSRAFRAIITRCPYIEVPGLKRHLYDTYEVLSWIKSRTSVPRVSGSFTERSAEQPPQESLHRRRGRPSNLPKTA